MPGSFDPPRGAAQDFIGLVRFDDLSSAEAAQWLAARPAEAPFAFVVTPNAQHIVLISRGDAYARAAAAAALVLNDSQVVRGLARLIFGQRLKLCAGSDLTLELLRHVLRPEDAVTIIGGTSELPGLLAEKFGLARITQHIPPMGYAEDPVAWGRAVQFALDHPARFTFVCTGTPRSEALLLAVHERGGGRGVGLSIGASLFFATDQVRRAPAPVRRLGLEWLWRLAQNPRRHARRVFVDSMPLLPLVAQFWWRGGRAHG